MNCCVLIAAAGRSTRFESGDKLAQDVGGRPLLIRTVEFFTKRNDVDSVIVAGPAGETFSEFRDRFGGTLNFHGAAIVEGDATSRSSSVRNALKAAPDDCTHIAVHDAARPCVTNELFDRLLNAVQVFDAVAPGVAVQDTIKRVRSEMIEESDPNDDAAIDAILGGDVGRSKIRARRVEETVSRENLVLMQTPQIFVADLLRRAYEQSGIESATDDASLVEQSGEPVHIVEGDPRNLKVTTHVDLELARMILGVRPPKERAAHLRF